MSEFDDALALTPIDERRSRGELTGDWAIGGAVNGGLLIALAARALGERLASSGGNASGHDEPVALSAYFLSASRHGPVEVQTDVIRVGRVMSTGQVSLFQPDGDGLTERVRALASFGDLRTWESPILKSPERPQMPDPDDCIPTAMAPEEFRREVAILGRLDLRLEPASAGWALGQPAKRGRILGWIRFADGRPIDALSLLFFLDALPPVAFDLGIQGWAPTLELTAYVRAEPVDGWLLVELSTSTVTGGLLEEDARIWDSTGRLVAHSRQLAGIRLPRDTEQSGS